ncbi:hypothetical protein CSOJ01_14763 [Colletotrichum sojae]|uniref:Uncharacterized protein n=1 Tax=Colletotrichum sojae TaxID=2175907 RepID=A0A8H6IPW5_9PEZI|nr:hypothetical protein CSOJ01_14763 [Colletotrichum sojae]
MSRFRSGSPACEEFAKLFPNWTCRRRCLGSASSRRPGKNTVSATPSFAMFAMPSTTGLGTTR